MQRPLSIALERTLALIKPDATKAGNAPEIVRRIHQDGFTVIQRRSLEMTFDTATAFYKEHTERSFFKKLIKFMTSGTTVAMVLTKSDAIRQWRELMGPTNSAIARQQFPNSIRALYGTDGTLNAVHGSDSHGSAEREIRFFFPDSHAYIPSIEKGTAEDMDESGVKNLPKILEKSLVEGLTHLAKTKPTAGLDETVHYLGTWLIDHNPNRPAKSAAVGCLPTPAGRGSDRLVMESRMECRTGPDAGVSGIDLLNEAATKVQAAYRGYSVRKNL